MTRNQKIEKCITMLKHFTEKTSLYRDMAMQANSHNHQMKHWDKWMKYNLLATRVSKLANKLFKYDN
jgi:hypothetical protein